LWPRLASAQDPAEAVLSHRIIPGWVQPDGTHMAERALALAPGWKTHWRQPGAAGLPPLIARTAAANLSQFDVHWPTPDVFWQSGMRSVGYRDRLVLPFTATPDQIGRDIRLRGRLQLGLCADVCIPAQLDFDALLPADAQARPAAVIAALANQPYVQDEAGVRAVACTLRPAQDGMQISAEITMPSAGGAEEAVIEMAPHLWISDPKATRQGGRLALTAQVMSVSGAPIVIDRSEIRITVIGQSYGVDIQGCPG